MKKILWYSMLFLSLGIACGGGGGSNGDTPPPSQPAKLVYRDPSGSGWKLMRNAASSTNTHLVLDVVGPTGGSGYGLALTLSVDQGKATWGHPASGDGYVSDVGYDLGTEPNFFRAVVRGDNLVIGAFQKGRAGSPTAYSQPLMSFALDINPLVVKGTVIPINVNVQQTLSPLGMTPISFSVGSLSVE